MAYPTQELEDWIFMKRKQGDDSGGDMSDVSSERNSIKSKLQSMVMGIDYMNDPIHSAAPRQIPFGYNGIDESNSIWKRLHSHIESNQSDESFRWARLNSEITPFSGNESLEILRQIQKDQQLDQWSVVRRPSSFSEKPDFPPDQRAESMLLTQDLTILNTMILDKLKEIKRQWEEIDSLNWEFAEIISQFKAS